MSASVMERGTTSPESPSLSASTVGTCSVDGCFEDGATRYVPMYSLVLCWPHFVELADALRSEDGYW